MSYMLTRLETLPRWLRDIAPLIFWMALIFVLSSRPQLVDIEDEIKRKLLFKTAHMIAYATLAWLWWRALAPQRQIDRFILLAAFVFTTMYGISDEIHQLFVPGRHGKVTDVFFDAIGASAMLLLIRRIEWLRF